MSIIFKKLVFELELLKACKYALTFSIAVALSRGSGQVVAR